VASSLTAFVDRYGFTWHSTPEVAPTRDIWCIHAMTLTYLHTRPTEGFLMWEQLFNPNNADDHRSIRIITYTTEFGRDNIQLYFGETSGSTHYAGNFESLDAIAARIRRDGSSMPRIMVNAGFFYMGSGDKNNGWGYSGWAHNGDAYGLYRRSVARIGIYGLTSWMTTLFYFSDGSVMLRNVEHMNYNQFMEITRNNDVVFAISGSIPSGTVYNGVALNRTDHPAHFYRASTRDTAPNIRTMMGVKPDGSIIFMVAYTDRTTGVSTNRNVLTVDAGAAILNDMGATYVLNLDGGSSTQMFFEGRRIMRRSYHGVNAEGANVGSVFKVW